MDVQLGASDGPSPLRLSPFNNKVGGLPDWPVSFHVDFDNKCRICSLPRPLVVQCYAPLEGSPYHRTLYVFACLNPACWNRSESWDCVRVQFKEENVAEDKLGISEPPNSASRTWCDDADDWDDDTSNRTDAITSEISSNQENSTQYDEEMEDIIIGTNNMKCTNANSRLLELQCISKMNESTAEIEIDDSFKDLIAERPAVPKCDVPSILNQKPNLPKEFLEEKTGIHFSSLYIRVFAENFYYDDEEANELLKKYEMKIETAVFEKNLKNKTSKKGDESFAEEEYEKGIPLHGDVLFHSFLSTIKMNPDQLIRYNLGGQPLLISELNGAPQALKCLRCGGKTRFEMQILPTLIPFLKLPGSHETHLEYGTAMIWSCTDSCWKDNITHTTEHVILQREPN